MSKITLLTDATSPVPGFESFQDDFIREMTARGMKLSTTTEFSGLTRPLKGDMTMPVLINDALTQTSLPTSHYGYSATRLDDLGASEYTLVTIVCDVSGSVSAFRHDLEQSLRSIVHACRLSPRADNLLLRLLAFDTALHELHGFKLLERCNLTDYDKILRIGSTTALYDATENAVSAVTDYARQLGANDFAANAIVFVLTDGMDNASKLTPRLVKQALTKAVAEESLESLVSVLIGVNVHDPQVGGYLQDFKTDVGFTQYVEIGHADARTLAKLADFVSRSISAQSQSLGTGGPSHTLTF